jgi:alpha-tubulin suppressor-like RCC1 family protein
MAWGSDGYGQIGDGQEQAGAALVHPYPYVLDSVPAPKQLSAGDNDSLLLTGDGHVWIWGLNNHGQLGDGTTNDRSVPAEMTTIDHVKQVAGGYFHNAAIKEDGTVWAWGQGFFGELGQGSASRSDQDSPVHVLLPKKATKLATGGEYTMALLEDGTVWAWGSNTSGQLGGATCPADPMQPCSYIFSPVEIAEIAALGRVADMSGIYAHALFALEDGSVWAMGLNWAGQLGIGSADPVNASPRHSTPVRVQGLGGVKVKAVAAGVQHSLALDAHGNVYGWGENGDGQAGNSSSPVPALVTTAREITCADGSACLRGATIVQAGHNSSEALVHGHVWAWGRADFGELGHIVPCCSATPLEVPGVRGVEMLSSNSEHTLAYGRYRANEVSCDHPSAYLIGDLMPLTGDVSSQPLAISNEGLAVGVSYGADGSQHAVLWGYDGLPFALGALPGDPSSQALAINDAGEIVGNSISSTFSLTPVRFTNGAVVPLPTLPGASSAVSSLNDLGVAVGAAYVAGDPNEHAVEFRETGAVDLGAGLLGGLAATSIDDTGEIIGYTQADDLSDHPREAVSIGPAGPKVLAANPAGYVSCLPLQVNQRGHAAGYCSSDASTQAVIYRGGAATLLGTFPGDSYSGAVAINARDQMVGISFTATSGRAVLFDASQVIDLATRVQAIGTWGLTSAQGINDNGQIVGMGMPEGPACLQTGSAPCPGTHGFLLTPVCDEQ